jgi:hypothetical protein
VDGGTIYPVPDTTWTEGPRCAASGAGLNWNAVDCNRDGKLDTADAAAGCAFTPDFAHPIVSLGQVSSGGHLTVDVTAAFQQGARVYAFAIRNGNTDGADYGSRESSRPPRLRLELE